MTGVVQLCKWKDTRLDNNQTTWCKERLTPNPFNLRLGVKVCPHWTDPGVFLCCIFMSSFSFTTIGGQQFKHTAPNNPFIYIIYT